jgi:hypothetical protein
VRVSRDTLLRIAREHAMWPTDTWRSENVTCSCGFELEGTAWIDDVVLSDLQHSTHGSEWVIAYPAETPEQSIGGVFVATSGINGLPVEAPHLAWLLDQVDLPDEFRRAAAVHLDQAADT